MKAACATATFSVPARPRLRTWPQRFLKSSRNLARRFTSSRADYNYGQIVAAWVKKYATEHGGEVVATEFFPLDVSEFGPSIQKIRRRNRIRSSPRWLAAHTSPSTVSGPLLA